MGERTTPGALSAASLDDATPEQIEAALEKLPEFYRDDMRIQLAARRAALELIRRRRAAPASVTIELAHRVFDKSEWGSGPWQDEPDLIVWHSMIEPERYLCQIMRNSCGSLCGYVTIPTGHPAHGLDLGAAHGLSAHRGVDFNGPAVESGGWTFGFHTGYAFDIQPLMDHRLRRQGLRPVREEPGCDLSEFGMGEEYRTVAYVRSEVEALSAQLVAVARIGHWPVTSVEMGNALVALAKAGQWPKP